MRCPEICCQKKKNNFKKNGTYRRKSDSRVIQRFFCKSCQKTYSLAFNDPAYNHKKRRINYPLKQLLASCISQRRAALILGVSRKTIARKLIDLGHLCRHMHQEFLKPYHGKIKTIQFDELQTIEHTKCKPLSVAVAVCVEDRKILGVDVSSMPATGYLAAISRRKYGKRSDHRRHGLKRLFSSISKNNESVFLIDITGNPVMFESEDEEGLLTLRPVKLKFSDIQEAIPVLSDGNFLLFPICTLLSTRIPSVE